MADTLPLLNDGSVNADEGVTEWVPAISHCCFRTASSTSTEKETTGVVRCCTRIYCSHYDLWSVCLPIKVTDGVVAVDDTGDALAGHVNHSPWDYVTLADFVMPFFLFMVGVSMSLSFRKYNKKGLLAKVTVVHCLATDSAVR